MTKEYKKSCRDELDWNAVEQLHESTLQISNSCFEFKKLCVGLIGIIVAALIKLGGSEIHILVFILPLIISIGFWICDSTAYYYQKKNRALMNKILNEVAVRNQAGGGLYQRMDLSGRRHFLIHQWLFIIIYLLYLLYLLPV